MADTPQVEKRESLRFWRDQLDLANKVEREWREDRAPKIVKKFRDEDTRPDNRFNILWPNTELMGSATYSDTPRPDVRRTFMDKDPAGRQAARILERLLMSLVHQDDTDVEIEAAVQDGYLPGRAVIRVRYEEETGENDEVLDQRMWIEYVDWRDYRHEPARREREETWRAYRHELSRKQLVARFKEMGRDVPLDKHVTPERDDQKADSVVEKAEIWEIWDKTARKVRWLSGLDEWLDTENDPLGLEGFFPSPDPWVPIRTNETQIPVPIYTLYQDQADELDLVNRRINSLTTAAKAAGVYAGSEKALMSQLLRGDENMLIPVEDWGALVDKGGLSKAIEWLPMGEIAALLQQLYVARDQLKNTIFELTGISDIMRGQSKASETLGAQSLKTSFGQVRVLPRRRSFDRFLRGLMRIAAEIYAELFEPETIARMTGITPEPPVMKLLRTEKLRDFRVRIETDSTVQPDVAAEQKARVEFVTAITQFLQTAGPLVQQGALPRGVAKALLMFGARSFKIGREVEDELEKIGEQPPPPPPGEQEKQQQMEMDRQELQLKAQEMQAKMQMEREKFRLEMAQKQQELEFEREKHALEMRAEEAKLALEREKLGMDVANAREDRRITRQEKNLLPPDPDRVETRTEIQVVQEGNLFRIVKRRTEQGEVDGDVETTLEEEQFVVTRTENGLSLEGQGVEQEQ